MLLLAQHERETIVLETSDGPIEVRLSCTEGTRARIGIEAPRSVRIIRRPVKPESLAATGFDAPTDDDNWWFHPDDHATDRQRTAQTSDILADWDDGSLD